jgi:hypothetical protein
MKFNEIVAAASLAPLVLGVAIACSAGCENKEKLLEVDTPNREVEITRDRDTGEVDVDAKDKDDKVLEIDTEGADVEINR